MATANAKAGRAKRTRQIPRSKISGPLALCNVTITLSGRSDAWLASPTCWTLTSQPSSAPLLPPGRECIGERALRPRECRWCRSPTASYWDWHVPRLWWRPALATSCGVFQVSQVVRGIHTHRGVGLQHIEEFVEHRILRYHKHFHREAICDRLQLLERTNTMVSSVALRSGGLSGPDDLASTRKPNSDRA